MIPDPVPLRLRFIASSAAILTAVMALIAFFGWFTSIEVLRRVLPSAVAMNPLTALGLLGAALGLWLAAHPLEQTARPRRLVSALVLLTGLSRLVDGLLPRPIEVDLLLFRSQVLALSPVPRMAYSTAFCLLAVGITLVVYRADARSRLPRLIIAPAALFALLALAGYVYQAEWLFSMPALHPMALNTSLALLALAFGITALPPPVAPTDKLVAEGVVGLAARRLIPAAFLIPFVLGYFRVYGERAGLFDMGFGTAAFVVLTAIVLGWLSHWSVHKVLRAEEAQHELQSEIRASEQRLFQILEALPVGVFVVNREGRPYYANQKSAEISGRAAMPDTAAGDLPRRYEVYRAGTGELYPAEDLPVARALRDERVYTADIELGRPDRRVPVEVWAAPVKGESGEIEYAISAYNDISGRLESARRIHTLNAELKHQVDELGVVNKELETFSYSVSHDLRAPLRAVDGFSKMLESDHGAILPADARRLLDRIRGNVRRMGALIDDLLRFSRLSRTDLTAAEVDIQTLVSNVVEDLGRQRNDRARIEVGVLPSAVGDFELLRQVWINLIDNALKYSSKRDDPRVEVSGTRDGDQAVYSVRDNGVGFDMAYADKLFGVFQRLHRQDEFEGTGVGLAIVQRVIHRHGGRVWAEAEPGHGAVFHFTLPAARGAHGGA